MSGKRARLQAQRTSRDDVIERRSQPAVIVVLERHEAERLQHAITHLARSEDLSHAMHRPGLRLECDLHKVALSQRLRHLEQAACNGNGLKFGFCAPAIFEANRSQNRVS